jgi:hypothetical protein
MKSQPGRKVASRRGNGRESFRVDRHHYVPGRAGSGGIGGREYRRSGRRSGRWERSRGVSERGG